MSSAKTSSTAVGPFKMFVRRSILKKVNNEHLQPINSWHIVRGDTVFVRTGRSAGHIGRVIDVLRTRNRLVVEGANLVKRHIRAEGNQPGGVILTPSAIHYSNLNLLDPTLNKPTKVSIRFTQTGEKARVSKKSGAVIPWPEPASKYERPLRAAEPGPRDTSASVAALITYEPKESLKPYLSRSSDIGNGKGSDGLSVFDTDIASSFRVPKLLRRVSLRHKNRNEIRRRFDTSIEKIKLVKDVNAVVRKVLKAVGEKKNDEKVDPAATLPYSTNIDSTKTFSEKQLR
jgi:large subunit ribosomal protein L24